MSNRALAQAFNMPKTFSGAHRLVMIALADSASSDTGHSFMGVARLAAYAAVSERTVQRALRDLERIGLIKTRFNQGGLVGWDEHRRPNLYLWRYDVADRLVREASWGDTGVTSPGDTGVTPSESWGDTGVTSPGDTGVTTPVTRVSPNPSIEPPSSNPPRRSPPIVGSVSAPQRADARPTTTADGDAETARRGTRIPDGFAITDAMAQWAEEKVPGLDVEAETERFADYWRAVPGQRGRKTDWVATWRNWMRRAHQDAKARGTLGAARPRLVLPTTDEAWDAVTQEVFTPTAYRDVMGASA